MAGFDLPINLGLILQQLKSLYLYRAVPFNALNNAMTMLRFVNKSVDLDVQDKIVNGLNRYNAATVQGKIGVISRSALNFCFVISRCCLS